MREAQAAYCLHQHEVQMYRVQSIVGLAIWPIVFA
jgi:hypothetical protein